jgi:hypothetical protein
MNIFVQVPRSASTSGHPTRYEFPDDSRKICRDRLVNLQ